MDVIVQIFIEHLLSAGPSGRTWEHGDQNKSCGHGTNRQVLEGGVLHAVMGGRGQRGCSPPHRAGSSHGAVQIESQSRDQKGEVEPTGQVEDGRK